MKKVLFTLFCAISLVCVSCNFFNSNKNEAVECDSTAVYVDSLGLASECDTIIVDTTDIE